MLFNYFEGSNEGIIGGEAEMRDSLVKCAERPLVGGKRLGEQDIYEIPLRLPMNDCAMETVEYMWIDICPVLDSVIELCHKTAEIHFPDMGCSIVSTQNETLLRKYISLTWVAQ